MSLLSDDLADPAEVVVNLATSADPLLCQWARFRDAFGAAMGDGFWTIEDLEQRIAHRRAFFFPGRDAAMIGQIEVYPGGRKVMEFVWTVGDTEEIRAMLPGVEAVARMMGCDFILMEGRKAWERVLRGAGFSPWSVTLFKAL